MALRLNLLEICDHLTKIQLLSHKLKRLENPRRSDTWRDCLLTTTAFEIRTWPNWAKKYEGMRLAKLCGVSERYRLQTVGTGAVASIPHSFAITIESFYPLSILNAFVT